MGEGEWKEWNEGREKGKWKGEKIRGMRGKIRETK